MHLLGFNSFKERLKIIVVGESERIKNTTRHFMILSH
jgi:hypothetical protein